jgi:hypothetical protein
MNMKDSLLVAVQAIDEPQSQAYHAIYALGR